MIIIALLHARPQRCIDPTYLYMHRRPVEGEGVQAGKLNKKLFSEVFCVYHAFVYTYINYILSISTALAGHKTSGRHSGAYSGVAPAPPPSVDHNFNGIFSFLLIFLPENQHLACIY